MTRCTAVRGLVGLWNVYGMEEGVAVGRGYGGKYGCSGALGRGFINARKLDLSFGDVQEVRVEAGSL